MAYELIITEKPQAAKKLAESLADGRAIKENIGGVPYYKLTHAGNDIVVGCAVGHLFTIAEIKKPKEKEVLVDGKKKRGPKKAKESWSYPVFDVEWVPTSKVSKGSSYTTKYVTALKKLSENANKFTVACDYDIEGEVIGHNVVKYICKRADARRMKFSTLTKPELVKSYSKASPTLNWGQAKAGLTRHEMDWYYGINLSRALTLAVKRAGAFKILSSGRVQGPALKIIADKEKEIQGFKPVPYWEIELNGSVKAQAIVAWHKEDKFWDKEKADNAFQKANGTGKDQEGKIAEIEKRQFNQAPPFPFDLTTLQTEAYRSLRLQPKKTLEVAQELYISGLISYPRTSSQKLPPEIGYEEILHNLSRQQYYKEFTNKLLSKHSLKPVEGAKTDPAHPAIFPTGQIIAISGEKAKLYDLIVRRFFACFGDPAKRETITITIDVNTEEFIAKGTRTVIKGWHEFYGPHVFVEEQEMPSVQKGDLVLVKEIKLHSKETQPPKRYTPASIIRELEKRSLGTKSTRAAIVDALFDRGYVNELSIEATPLGIRIVEVLEKYSPEIVDEALTRHFEEEMDKIVEEKITPEEVLDEVKKELTATLTKFKKNELEIGKQVLTAISQTRDKMALVGKCSKCGGNLEIRRGKFGQFIACDNYPNCTNTSNLPNNCLVKGTEDLCKICGSPMVKIIKKGKIPQKLCINSACPSKKMNSSNGANTGSNSIDNNTTGISGSENIGGAEEALGKAKSGAKKEKSAAPNETVVVDKPCPKCTKPLVLRKSIYGEFLGCSGFPKCRYTEKINGSQ